MWSRLVVGLVAIASCKNPAVPLPAPSSLPLDIELYDAPFGDAEFSRGYIAAKHIATIRTKELDARARVIDTVEYAYDAYGNETGSRALKGDKRTWQPLSSRTYELDDAGRVVAWHERSLLPQSSRSMDETISYDAAGRVTTRVNTSTGTEHRTYSADGRLATITKTAVLRAGAEGGDTVTMSATYAGDRLIAWHGVGLAGPASPDTPESAYKLDYDPAGRLTSFSKAIWDFAYSYDADGKLARMDQHFHRTGDSRTIVYEYEL